MRLRARETGGKNFPSPVVAGESSCYPVFVFRCAIFSFFLRLTFPRGHFPRLEECAHFHYETVDFGNVQVSTE
uniref:Uncharacterized protein n=1 Tax=Labrus bergylta TaxID=56723 RepID=A0A3Q3N8T5_9LABR